MGYTTSEWSGGGGGGAVGDTLHLNGVCGDGVHYI